MTLRKIFLPFLLLLLLFCLSFLFFICLHLHLFFGGRTLCGQLCPPAKKKSFYPDFYGLGGGLAIYKNGTEHTCDTWLFPLLPRSASSLNFYPNSIFSQSLSSKREMRSCFSPLVGIPLSDRGFHLFHPHAFPANTKGEKAGAFKKGGNRSRYGKSLFFFFLGGWRRWRFERILSLLRKKTAVNAAIGGKTGSFLGQKSWNVRDFSSLLSGCFAAQVLGFSISVSRPKYSNCTFFIFSFFW